MKYVLSLIGFHFCEKLSKKHKMFADLFNNRGYAYNCDLELFKQLL